MSLQISKILSSASSLIARLIELALIMASLILLFDVAKGLIDLQPEIAIRDGLFVMILLEMVYVVRSFIKHGSINVGLVVNVGLIAVVKEIVFKLDSLTLQMAIAFAVLLVSLGVVYVLETIHFHKKKEL